MKKSQSEAMKVFFKDKQLRTVGEVMKKFNCSRGTVFRHFREGEFLTSINFRGQYHISATGVKFNRYGLYKRNGKVFSSHGNLLETITWLISNSSSGMSVSEISRIVETDVNMQCQDLFKKGLVHREKYGKGYCYFSIEAIKRRQQLTIKNTTGKESLNSAILKETLESLRNVVMILVTFINNPEFSPKSIALSLSRRGMDMTTEKVKAVFEKYDLAKKNY